MRNKIIGIRSLFLQMLISLLILAVGLLAAFLVLAWFEGSLKLPGFLVQHPPNAAPTSLIINVLPADAKIMINQEPYGPNNIYVPGDYVIQATREGFLPVEEIVHIHPDQKNQINLRLMPVVTIQPVAEDATTPGWDQQGNLFYLNRFEGKLYKWVKGSTSAIADIPGSLYQLQYLPSGTYALALISQGEYEGNKLYKINLITGELIDLPITGFTGLGQDGETIWGINDNPIEYLQKPVWSLPPGGNLKLSVLDNPEWANGGSQLLIDPSGLWLAIESKKGIAIWEIASGKLAASFENAFAPVWIQKPKIGLAFLNVDHSLNFSQSNLNWDPTVVLTDIQSPIARMPNSSEIVFSRYNPFAGGASFWAVDTTTMSIRLLSEAKIEAGRVEQFSISLDGKRIVFINQKNILYLIVLEQ